MSLMQRFLFIFLCSTLLSGCVTAPGSNFKDVFSQRSRAETFYQAGDYENALPEYQRLIKLVPDLAEAWLRLGNCHSRLGDYSSAVIAYEAAIARNPSYVKAWYNLSYVRAQVLASTVVQMYQQVPKDDPEARQIQSLVGSVLKPFGEDLSGAFPPQKAVVDSSSVELNTKPEIKIEPVIVKSEVDAEPLLKMEVESQANEAPAVIVPEDSTVEVLSDEAEPASDLTPVSTSVNENVSP